MRQSYHRQLTLGCVLTALLYVVYLAWIGAEGLWGWVAGWWKSPQDSILRGPRFKT